MLRGVHAVFMMAMRRLSSTSEVMMVNTVWYTVAVRQKRNALQANDEPAGA